MVRGVQPSDRDLSYDVVCTLSAASRTRGRRLLQSRLAKALREDSTDPASAAAELLKRRSIRNSLTEWARQKGFEPAPHHQLFIRETAATKGVAINRNEEGEVAYCRQLMDKADMT